ncbi:hypothetical protein OZN62_10855 [Aurantiacibacter sp. MUD11]|uniref:hypothetical protein n=1 Tax=Aurantiacibacter sp. MUD11 TaxID=3003265 RepID=UPI0022AA923B|nr:hypothetical protein [Aurantiacibacter sp. MUD11]WAT17417.1 hypothetical protein OZN62_10855 [Aurantiacibacter sp. MUD11]
MKVARRSLLVGGAAAAAGAVTGPAMAQGSASSSAEPWVEETPIVATREQLEAICDAYCAALVAGDPARAPFHPECIFAENDQVLPLGEAAWKTTTRFGSYKHYYADPQHGEVGLVANSYEQGGGCVFVLRLKVDADHRITEAEQFIARDPNGAAAYERLGAPDPVWLEPIPPAQRQSHEALQAVSWMYFQALERNDGAGVYPFRPDCERIEHARPTVAQPQVENYGHSDATTRFITLEAKAQYELGLMAFVTKIRDRKTLVVDVERGAVLGSGFYDFDGALETINFDDGTVWDLPPYFRTPRSHHANEGFKIINGSFRYVEMTFIEVPFGTRHVFPGSSMTVSLDYTPAKPAAQPARVATPAEHDALTDRIVDAMARNCPCDLPLAHDARYTENGVPVKLGTGNWWTFDGKRDWQVHLADPASGQGGWMGAIDERGLFAQMALRWKMVDGLITELETVTGRPQAPSQGRDLAEATYTMFWPPLVRDVLAEGYTGTPDVFRAPTPADRLALESAVRDMEATGNDRVNGHAVDDLAALHAGLVYGGMRPWLVDEARGLGLGLSLWSNSGVGSFAEEHRHPRSSPWTDLHARLVKLAHGNAATSEELVVRVPFGQGSGWDG